MLSENHWIVFLKVLGQKYIYISKNKIVYVTVGYLVILGKSYILKTSR